MEKWRKGDRPDGELWISIIIMPLICVSRCCLYADFAHVCRCPNNVCVCDTIKEEAKQPLNNTLWYLTPSFDSTLRDDQPDHFWGKESKRCFVYTLSDVSRKVPSHSQKLIERDSLFRVLLPLPPPLCFFCFVSFLFGSGISPQLVRGPRGVPVVPGAGPPVGLRHPHLPLVQSHPRHIAPGRVLG